jgi:hypothetical protein
VCIRGYPEIAGLPHPFQKMLSIKLNAAAGRIAAGRLAPIYEDDMLVGRFSWMMFIYTCHIVILLVREEQPDLKRDLHPPSTSYAMLHMDLS